jgi:hypothetical protein
MDWTTLLSGALGAGLFSLLLKLIDVFSARSKTRADAAKTIVDGGAQAVKVMQDLLKEYDTLHDKQTVEIEALRTGREERARKIDELEQKNEDLQAAIIQLTNQIRETGERQQLEIEETQRLRNDYAMALKQIIRLEDLAIGLGEYVDAIMTAAKKAGMELPINGDLMDSVLRLKAEREARSKKK